MVFDGDFPEVVAFANLVIGCRSLRFCGGQIRRVRLGRCRGGNTVSGDVHGVVFQAEIVEVNEPVRVDVDAEVADLEVEMGAVGASRVAA